MNTLYHYFNRKFHKVDKFKFWGLNENVNIPVKTGDLKGNVIEICEGNYTVEFENKHRDTHVIFGLLSKHLMLD